jgi:hypothetical protein
VKFKANNVTAPDHYTAGGIETIDFILAKGLDYNLGNVVKYVSRAGKKDKGKYLEDLQKAKAYLQWAINIAQNGNRSTSCGTEG